MKLLSRLFTVCLLLCGLAYGSYAFGKYVLSTKLFGQSVTPSSRSGLSTTRTPKVAESVTRQFNYHGGKPKVELEVLPAEDAGPGPETGGLSSTRRTPDTSTIHSQNSNSQNPSNTAMADDSKSGRHRTRNIDTGLNFWSDEETRNGYGNGYDKEHPRRRRRRHHSTTTTGVTDASTARTTDTGAAGTSDGDSSSGSDSSNSGSTESSGGDYSSHSTGSSEAASSGDSGGGEHRATRHRRRERSRESHDSPVPRPEGESSHSEGSGGSSGGSSGGGESPVPQPE